MKINKKHLLGTIFLPIQFVLVQLAAKNPAFIEDYYSNGIYPNIAAFLRIIFGWIPFSVGDINCFPIIYFYSFFLQVNTSKISKCSSKNHSLYSNFIFGLFLFLSFLGIELL